jgi:hypothetical protein
MSLINGYFKAGMIQKQVCIPGSRQTTPRLLKAGRPFKGIPVI